MNECQTLPNDMGRIVCIYCRDIEIYKRRITYLQSLLKPKNQLIKRLTKLLDENNIEWRE